MIKKVISIIKKLIFINPIKKSSTLQKYGLTNQREKRIMYMCFKHDLP